MTIEQLLCPAVQEWEDNFSKKLNESHIEMSGEEIEAEFDKWLIENEDLVNKSVEDNIEQINEIINRNMNKATVINEGGRSMFDEFDDDDEPAADKADDEDDDPIDGSLGGEKIDPDEPEEERSKLTGAVRLNNDKTSKNNVFGVINEFYDVWVERKTNHNTHKGIMRKLDVTNVRDMSALFAFTDIPNLDLSSWNTGNVKHMEGMFYKSTFNNDSICGWDVSRCADFKNMFLFCPFNYSLKTWTPDFVSKTVQDETGHMEKKMVRADLPILGGTEDEERSIAKTYRRKLLSTLEDEEADEDEIEENNNMKHLVDYDTFVNEGRFRDFIDKGVEKVKNFFKGVAMKIGKLVAFFNEDGGLLPAVSAYTALNVAASGEIPGVTAFCNVQNEYLEGVPAEASVVENPEYYGIVKQNSVEYQNFETFAGMVNEHYQKYGTTGFDMVNEEEFKRVGFSADDGGVQARDIHSDDLRELLEDLIMNVPAYKGGQKGGKPVFIWGAPGIGKSTIPKAIVKAWNKNEGDATHQKGLMVIQCGDLTPDGFSLPIPVEKSIGDYLDERPVLKDKVSSSGLSTDQLEKIRKSSHKVSTEAPKTWLPAYNTNAAPDEISILNDIANGYLDIKENEDGTVTKTETTEGGILLFDEFFRADPNIFKILMQLILNREYSGYKIGNKWGILCCSNRPNDDEEVMQNFEKSGAVVGNRLLAGAYNFIPSFEEWKKWALTDGGFDPVTLEFLIMDKDPITDEYTNWHTIRPEQYVQKGKTAWPTPRSWSALMDELHLYMENHGYSSILEIPEQKIRMRADGIIGEEMAVRYVGFLKSHAASISVDAQAVLENPDYEIPASSKCSDVVRQLEHYVTLKYADDNLPDVNYLINMFNKLDQTYTKAKDNFVKIMHINIIKFFKVFINKENMKALKPYLKLCEERFSLTPKDFD